MTNTSDWDVVGKADYVSFTSFRKDGTPVATPVWIAPSDGRLYFFSETKAWKVKRIARNPNVTLQPCSVRGAIKPGSPVVEGTARVLEFSDASRVRKILNRKYGIMARLSELGARVFRSADFSIPIEISPR
ncbi:PPOX class F420-dependent oxidoreductase [Smaragdicoccus niigatensis]|uniref:PPOX class F420-dependent oxidoreductase n=1 Tax=Smaragdicoccus niigatensis TaxID=359359 RepID=UPI000380BC6B|nr:PPOX class F420-dependent oxidoreductase [Smaragdicoccus niigatensis]